MRARISIKVLSFVWLVALAALGVLALDSSVRLHAQYPFMHAFLFNHDTINANSYTSGNTSPISLGAIKNNVNANLQLKLRFRADNTEGHPNVFQTAPVNSGIRMEISGATASLIIPDKLEPGGLKGLVLTSTLKTGQWYELEVDALNGAFVRAKLDGLSVANYVSAGISMETGQLLVGGGFDETRVFRGQIEKISLTKSFLPSSKFQRVFYLVLLVGLIVLLVRLWKRLLLDIPKKAKVVRECLKHIDWIAFISIALILAAGLTLYTAFLFPLYPDEIQIRFWLSRFPYDFPERISGFPGCPSTYLPPVLSTMYLPGLINWAVTGWQETVPALRHAGNAVALFWLAGLALYLYSRTKKNFTYHKVPFSNFHQSLYSTGFIIAIFSVGTLPIFLIINRNEQLILPSVALLIAIFIFSSQLGSKGRLWQRIGLIVLYFTAVSLILYGHAKGLFFTPLFILIGWQLFRDFKFRLPIILGAALLTLHVMQYYFAWKTAFQCSEEPQLEALLKSFSFDPASLIYAPNYFFNQAYHSLMRFPEYWHQLGFLEQTDASYLPNLPLTASAIFVNIFIKLNVAVVFFSMMFFLPYQYYRKDILAGRFITINLVLLTVFVCTVISAIFNLPKHWYDAGYLYALMLIILTFFVGEGFHSVFQKSAMRKIFVYLGIVAILSQAVFIQRNLPAFLAGFSGAGISIEKYDAISINDNFTAAAKICSIDPAHSKNIVVDDYSYLYFQRSKAPMGITYVWWYKNDKSVREFFSKGSSDGLEVMCSSLPWQNLPFVKRVGNVCCIPKEGLKNLLLLP
jgi:hypothetical protein